MVWEQTRTLVGALASDAGCSQKHLPTLPLAHQASLTMPSSLFVSDACRIWMRPSEERTMRDLQEPPAEDGEKARADLSGDDSSNSERDARVTHQEEAEQLAQLNEELKKVETSLPSMPAVKNCTGQRSFRLAFLRPDNGNSVAPPSKLSTACSQKKTCLEVSCSRKTLSWRISPASKAWQLFLVVRCSGFHGGIEVRD